jgi:hypothetical protein
VIKEHDLTESGAVTMHVPFGIPKAGFSTSVPFLKAFVLFPGLRAMHTAYQSAKLKGRDNLGELGVDGEGY